MGYKHGTSVSENPTSLKAFNIVKTPAVIIGMAPINQIPVGKRSINKTELIMNVGEATEIFGGPNLVEGFTISEALYVFFQLFGVSPIICVNVIDPSKHKTSKELNEAILIEGKYTFKEVGILPETLELTTDIAQLKEEDYSWYFEPNGQLTIEIHEKEIVKVAATYDFLDISKVTKTDIIGSIDLVSLEAKGLELLGGIYQKYSMIPSVVITPNFSSDSEVRAILDTKASLIGGKWGSMSIVELPDILKYGETIKFKKDKNFIDEDQILVYGKGRMGEKIFHQDILLAALMNSVDGSNDGIPYESPSNKNIKVEGISYKLDEEYVSLSLEENQANLLNENGILTIIQRPNGTVAWGNHTSAFQPGGTTDVKDIMIPIKRMFKFIGNTIMLNTEAEVDKPMTYAKAESIKTDINVFLNSLTSQGKILGGRVEFLESENPKDAILSGQFKWHLYFGGVIPGQSLHYILEYDPGYLKAFFS